MMMLTKNAENEKFASNKRFKNHFIPAYDYSFSYFYDHDKLSEK